MNSLIESVRGRRVWDSRGRPTVEAEITLAGGSIGRAIGVPASYASRASPARYGMSESLSRVNRRVTSTASSSNAHGTRYDDEPCSRECEESRPNASQRFQFCP